MSQRVPWAALKNELHDRIRQAVEQSDGWGAVRVRIPVEPADGLAWLLAQPTPAKTYWANRSPNFQMAGVGAADMVWAKWVTGYEELFALVEKNLSFRYPDLRYYGTVRFAPHHTPDDRWAPFGGYRFVMPRFELMNREGDAVFACNMCPRIGRDLAQERDAALAELEDLRFETADTPAARQCMSRHDLPARGDWEGLVDDALREIKAGDLDKVVLARESQFVFEDPLDPIAVLARLARHTPDSYHFCFQTEPGVAFIGASPEQLYFQRNMYVRSEALAGTRPRGDTPTADARLGRELLDSDKDQREHRIVLDSIRETMQRVCRTAQAEDEVRLQRLPHCQHLCCAVEGLLAGDVPDSELLQALHPTPAVAGHPTPEALAAIARLEPFDRGHYAGPAGWLGYDAAEFAVAIRSGLVRDNTLSLYAGAGIVEGSKVEDEWDEVESKIVQFLAAMDEDDGHSKHQ